MYEDIPEICKNQKKEKKKKREKKMAFFVQKNALEQVNALSTNDNIKKVPTLRNVDDFCQSIF